MNHSVSGSLSYFSFLGGDFWFPQFDAGLHADGEDGVGGLYLLGLIAQMVHADGGVAEGHPQVKVTLAVGDDGIPRRNETYADVGFYQRLTFLVGHCAFHMAAVAEQFGAVGGIELVNGMQMHPQLTLRRCGVIGLAPPIGRGIGIGLKLEGAPFYFFVKLLLHAT